MKHLICLLLCLNALAIYSEEKQAPPNVLFIIADDLSAEALGCYGNEQVHTPHIDALAERGVRFTHAYCQYPVCGPARAAIMSGLYPQQNGVTGNADRDILSRSLGDHPTLPEHFKNNGYTTARCGKIYHMRVPGHITAGVHGPDHPDSWTERYSFKAPEQWTPGKTALLSHEELKPDPDRNIHYRLGYGTAFFVVEDPTDGTEQHDVQATDKAIELIDKYKDGDKPFFLAVGYVRPHVPLVAPQPYFDLYQTEAMKLATWPRGDRQDIPQAGITRVGQRSGTDTDAKRKGVLRAYYASVSFMDAQVGRLLDELDKQGLTDNTIVVFLSDHGYHLGEHDFWQKMSLHEESVRIPLIIASPSTTERGVSSKVVESIDLYPTLSVHAKLPVPQSCKGHIASDLDQLLDMRDKKAKPGRLVAYSMSRNGHMLRSKAAAYMRYNDGSEEFYDMEKDPQQFTNLAKVRERQEEIDWFRKALDDKLQSFKP
jgi:iduronate 2-sulfatase